MPKSRIFAVPSGSMMMFEGLTSRWTIPRLVRVSQSARDLQRNRERFLERESAALQARLQRFTIVERHGDEQLPVVGLADLVDRCTRSDGRAPPRRAPQRRI